MSSSRRLTKPIIITLFTGIFFLFGLFSLAKSSALFFGGRITPGTVSMGAGNQPFLVYSDQIGNSHIEVVTSVFGQLLTERESVQVIYNPSNPKEVTVNSFLFLWVIGLVTAAIGGIGLITAVLNQDWGLLIALTGGGNISPEAPETAQKNAAAQYSESSPTNVSSKQAASGQFDKALMSNIFGVLRPLIDDEGVSDIIMASPSTIFAKKGTKIIKSPVIFPNKAKYEELIDRMLAVADNSYSISKPIVDGMVTPMVRIHAVHEVLCEEGPYVTLRISRFNSLKYADLIRGTMAPKEILAYLRGILLSGNTILIAGEVGTGKTSLIRGLASTISENESILVIEDTAEIKIDHPVVRYVRTRLSNIEGVGKVSPGECIKAGMRMAMNRIIFGEIRDPEAAESFIDVCVSGHPGMSTIHARSAEDAVIRLELLLARQQSGVDRFALREQVASAVQVIVLAELCRETGQRRISEVIELRRGTDGNPIETQEIFRYSVSGGMPVWKVVNRKSFFHESLKEFEGGSALLTNTPDWLTLPDSGSRRA